MIVALKTDNLVLLTGNPGIYQLRAVPEYVNLALLIKVICNSSSVGRCQPCVVLEDIDFALFIKAMSKW